MLLLLASFAAQMPGPWNRLWLFVPVAVATSLIAAWRSGAWAVLLPIGIFAVAMWREGPYSMWVWWIPMAALVGVWMGLREEGAGPASGEQAWMLLPVLLLAAVLPWAVEYPALVSGIQHELASGDARLLALGRDAGYDAEKLASLGRTLEAQSALRARILPSVLPSVLFVWMVMLIAAGRAWSGASARLLRWPPLSRASLRSWRMPDGVIWVLLAGIALLVTQWRTWAPTGWTLLINAALGYCVQGIAVVESLLLARGVPPSIVVLTLVFVFMVAMPVFVMTTVAVGISDVWLDYRRLEPAPDGEEA